MWATQGATAFDGITLTACSMWSQSPTRNFIIDVTAPGTIPNAGGSGGGSGAVYNVENLVQGMPIYWAIWDETIFFDAAFAQSVDYAVLQYSSRCRSSRRATRRTS